MDTLQKITSMCDNIATQIVFSLDAGNHFITDNRSYMFSHQIEPAIPRRLPILSKEFTALRGHIRQLLSTMNNIKDLNAYIWLFPPNCDTRVIKNKHLIKMLMPIIECNRMTGTWTDSQSVTLLNKGHWMVIYKNHKHSIFNNTKTPVLFLCIEITFFKHKGP